MSENISENRGKHNNPNSLANLNKGGVPRKKPRISTKSYVLDIAEMLQADLEIMFKEIKSLPVKDRLKFKLELLKLIIPKMKEINTTSTNTENKVDWSIKLAQPNDVTTIHLLDKNEDND